MRDESYDPPAAHVAAASLNQTVGDWTGNVARIGEVISEARQRGARLLCLPEMCIPGYSLGDRLSRLGTMQHSWHCLEQIAPWAEDLVVCVGLPIVHRGVIFNTIAVLSGGEIRALVAKENLATGDVEYEDRWYQAWRHGTHDTFRTPSGGEVPIGNMIFEASGLGRFALEICEDGWKGVRPGSIYALAGAEIVANPSASWFIIGKHAIRRRIVVQISQEDHVAYLYTSLLGCDATRLVFDGSVFIAANGKVLGEGRRFLFTEKWELIDTVLDLDEIRQTRREEGSWRHQVQAVERGEYGQMPQVLRLPGEYGCGCSPPAPRPYWLVEADTHPDVSLQWVEAQAGSPIRRADLPHIELELALCLGLREYLAKSGLTSVALALSGGRDSAMVALLTQRMFMYDNPQLGKLELEELVREHFLCAYLATENSGSSTRGAARAIAEEIGATFYDVDIQSAFETHTTLVEQTLGRPLDWNDTTDDIALQNVQARLRGSFIWLLANLRHALLLSTSNKSEAGVGYTTMDGDTSGGIAPIADVPKSLVTTWLRWAAEFHGYESLQLINELEPTAELRPPERGQKDEDDLMPFDILDQLLYHFVQKGQDPLDMFKMLWPRFEARYESAQCFENDIRKFVRLLCFAQWKRERFAISFRVTAFDLDPKTGFRFPPIQVPFREELAELAEYVATLP